MKRFVFRLDSILKMRAREEDSARDRLERCLAVQRRAERDLDEANLQLEQSEQALGDRCGGKASIHDHLIFLNAVRLQREHCMGIVTRIAAASRETEAHRQIFQTARRKHQAVVRLQERHSRAHAADERRREENEISDFIISRHIPADSRACG